MAPLPLISWLRACRLRLPPEEEIRERGHGYALAGNPALERSHPEGGNRTLRIAPRRRRGRSATPQIGGSSTLATRRGPPASAPGLERPGHVFYGVPRAGDLLEEDQEEAARERQEAAAAAARLERQLRLGRDAIADSLGLLELPVAVPEVLAPGAATRRPATAEAVMVGGRLRSGSRQRRQRR